MNLSKITIPMMSLVSIISLSTSAVAGTAEIVKKQQLQQLKLFQLSQSQPGKILQKATSGSKEITVTDSMQTYTWENSLWEKSACTRYSYDSKGRVKEEITVSGNDGSDTKNTYEYDVDGKTIKTSSIWNLNVDGELFMSETTYSLVKYYPGYTDAIIRSMASEYTAFINFENGKEFNDLDSVVTIAFDGVMDTTFKSFTKYTKIGDKVVRSNSTFTSMTDENESMSYHTDYIFSGSGSIDTTKCVIHFDGGLTSVYEELLSEMQYMMFIFKKNQGHVVEHTVLTAKDSTFASCSGNSKMFFYTNSKGEVDSLVIQEWDTLAQVWENSGKEIYSLKKISVGVKESIQKPQAVQQVTFEKKHGALYLDIPSGMTVSVLEQLDLQGKVLSRTSVPDAKSRIVFSPIAKNNSTVSLVRLKTNRGNFVCKVSSVK